jgi:hypothetical protein
MFNQTKRRAGQPSVITATPCAPPALSAIYSKDLHTNGIEHPTVQSYRVQSNFTRCPATWQHHIRQVTQHVPSRRRVTSLRQRLQRLPAPAIDAGLALAVAVVLTITIRVSPPEGRRPDALAYALGLTIAALLLVRRRWPLAVLLVSAATLQVYYLLDYAGIRPAVPLAVALATAWGAGHLRWSLLVTAWFAAAPLLFRTLVDPEPLRRVLNDSVPDVVLFAAVLLLGEAVRNRRALDWNARNPSDCSSTSCRPRSRPDSNRPRG